MSRIETWYKQDLKKPVPVRRLETVFNQDALGHLFGVEVYDNGQPVTLSGSVNGYCLLADGTTVPVLGTRTENKAYIVLPQTAYNVLGPITITVKLTEGTAITTLLAVVGVVARSRSGQQVNPGSTITDWTNQIADALQDVEDASAAQDAKISDLKAALTLDENSFQWWADEDPVFNSRNQRMQNCLKHIRDIQIFTRNKSDVFTLNETYLDNTGKFIIHVIANGTDTIAFNIAASNTPVWTSKDKNGRTVKVLCDTNGLTYPEDYVSTVESISINYRCVNVIDNTFTETYFPADAKATGDQIASIENVENLDSNGMQWWKSGDSVFDSRSLSKKNGLKHIRNIQIFTRDKTDTYVLNETYINNSGVYVIHVIANGTISFAFSVSGTSTPVWSTKEKNGRIVKVLCDTDGLTEQDYVSTLESIAINENCIHVIDDSLTESYVSADAKVVGDKIDDINLIVPLYKTKYKWSFYGTVGNPTGWMNGRYDASTGESDTSKYYLRTLKTVNIIQSIPGARRFTINAPKITIGGVETQMAVRVYEYDANDDTFIGYYGQNDIRQADATPSVTVNVKYGRNYKFSLGRFPSNDSDQYITPSNINAIELIVYYNYDINDINDYYFPYLDGIVDKVNTKANAIDSKSFGFIFITDHHYLRNAFQSPKLINYLMKKTGVHTVIFGGDAFQNWKDQNEQNSYVNMVYSTFEHCGETDYFCVTGNHEWNDMTGEENTQAGINVLTTNRQRNHVLSMDQYGNYFSDDIVSNTRFFFLSTQVSGSISWNSILWLGNSLLNVPDGYNVMVIAHAGVLKENGVVYQKNTYMNVSKLLGAFDRSEAVSLYDSENVLKGSFDYTGKNGTAICYLCGHTHEDMSIAKAEDVNHVLLICTTGDLLKDASGNHYEFVDEQQQTITRNIGTIYEQAFDVIQVDPTAKKIYCTRVGAGLDREFSY